MRNALTASALAGLLPLLLAACSPNAVDAASPAGELGAESACAAEPIASDATSGLPRARICLDMGENSHAIVAELARTPGEQARGLMFRERLDDDAGMLFPYAPPRPASFWMKNTLIPLDLVFVSPGGRVESIIANAEPLSLTPLRSRGPVSAVLELRGGRAAELGLSPGDHVRWPR